MKTVKSLKARIAAKKAGILEILCESRRLKTTPTAEIANFDNQPTWDNWPNKGGDTFDNQPTWDNWPNKT